MLRRVRNLPILLTMVIAVPTAAQDGPVQALLASPAFKTATVFIEQDEPRFVKEIIEITEIPAPPFKEERRAKVYAEMLRQNGLSDVEMDTEGNVMGVRRGTAGGQMVAVVAHLDTVFPEGTDVKVKRDGTRLMAPGISDNSRGAALLLAVARAMDAGKFQTTHDVLFVGNVGEEGEGDLRGVKFLLQKGKYKDRIKQFIAVDDEDLATIHTGSVGSRRYRVTFKGPGGHSYTAFGLVNPAYAMATAITQFARIKVPTKPTTTYSIGVVRGGMSVNSIPTEVSMDVDMRSEGCAELKTLEDRFREVVNAAVLDENKSRSTKNGNITADLKLIGNRPCGETPRTAPIVANAAAVLRGFGMTPVYSVSSTDSNVAMNLGIPAITIGRGPGERTHALDESTTVEPKESVRSIQLATAIILSVAGVKP